METESSEALTEAVRLLLADGPVDGASVVEALDRDGHLDWLRDEGIDDEELLDEVLDEILVTDEFWVTPDVILALTSPLADRMVATHIVTADELANGEVLVTPDLVLLDWNCPDGLLLDGGGKVKSIPGLSLPGEDRSTLRGPKGWLDNFGAGDLLAFVRTGDSLRVEKVERVEEDSREVAALVKAVAARLPEGHGEDAVALLWDALVYDPTAFRRPVRPVGELLEGAGLSRRGFSFGRGDEDWKTFSERHLEIRSEKLAEAQEMGSCCREALRRASQSFEAFQRDGSLSDPSAVAAALGHGGVAASLAELYHYKLTDSPLGEFAARLVEGRPGRASVPARYLLAVALDRQGDALAAESQLRTALAADPTYGPAALALAGFEIDRGNLDRAATLLRHPDLEPPDLQGVDELRVMIDAPYRGIGRNDMCPCGSSRKFKVCCQKRRRLALSVRTAVIGFKLVRFLTSARYRTELFEVAFVACDPDDPDPASSMASLARDAVIVDFTLFEAGVAKAYLDERGALLPGDERDLLVQMLDEPRRLWEIVAVTDVGLTLRDTATGDVVHLAEKAASRDWEQGDLFLARVLRTEKDCQVVGAMILVPLRLRDSALALVDSSPDVDAWAEWYGSSISLPRFTNREGEKLVMCRTVLRAEQGGVELDESLDAALGAGEDGQWTDTLVLPDGQSVIRGFVNRDGRELIVEANSIERIERLVGIVRQAVPDAVTVSDERTDARQAALARRAEDDFDEDDFGDFDDDDFDDDDFGEDEAWDPPPEAVAALEEIMRKMEANWVDEPVPALGGLTPREARDDPTRREDLLALLREFDDRQAASVGMGRGFDVERLRSLLGL